MAITRTKKEEIVAKVKDILANSENVTFVRFHGLPVDEADAMRQHMREQGVGYTVAKKTLVKRALSDVGYTDVPELEGELALAYSTDPVAPAREVHAFGKKREGSLAILGGIFEGKMQSATQMNEIATIPSLHELHGMFANVINSPIQGLVVALGQVAEKKA